MKHTYTLLLCCWISLPLIAEEVELVIEKRAGGTDTFIVSKDVVQVFGMSLDLNDGGTSYQVAAVCRDNKVVISEEVIASKDGIMKESSEKTSIPVGRLPYVLTPTNPGFIKKISLSKVTRDKGSKSQRVGGANSGCAVVPPEYTLYCWAQKQEDTCSTPRKSSSALY